MWGCECPLVSVARVVCECGVREIGYVGCAARRRFITMEESRAIQGCSGSVRAICLIASADCSQRHPLSSVIHHNIPVLNAFINYRTEEEINAIVSNCFLHRLHHSLHNVMVLTQQSMCVFVRALVESNLFFSKHQYR